MRNAMPLPFHASLFPPILLMVAGPAWAGADDPAIAGSREILASGLYTGFLLATALLNLVAAFASRRMLHGWFALFVACTAWRWTAVDGLMGLFLASRDGASSVLIGQVLLGAQMVTGSMCQIHLLDLHGHHRLLLRYYQWFGVLPGGLVILASGSPFFDEVVRAMFVALLPAPLLSIPAYLRLWRCAGLSGRLIAAALPLHFLVMLPATLGNIGVLPFHPSYIELARLASLPVILALHAGIGLQVRGLARERDEAKLHEARALAAADGERRVREERERLLSVITHEVRTPVAVIDAAAHSLRLLDQRSGSEAPPREARYRSIRQAVLRMRSLMELTEATERLQQSPADLAPADVLDLAGISRNIQDALDPAMARRVSIRAGRELPELQGNARLIYFGLFGLLDNAVKYAHPDTPIRIDIDADPQRPGVVWQIRDYGPGIPRDKRDVIFERYRRLDESSGQPGLGLGLTLSRQIVEQHGGQLRLDDGGWPHGACFTVWLPQVEIP